MSLLFIDGFDVGDITLKWDVVANPSQTFTDSTTRYGSGLSGAINSSGDTIAKKFTATAEIFCGFQVKAYGGTVGTIWSCRGDNDTTTHIYLKWNGSTIEAYRGDNTLLGSGAAASIAAAFRHVQVYVKVADSGGRVVVKYENVTVIDYTGDTKNAGTNTSVDSVRIGRFDGIAAYFDDFWLCDAAGSTHNTFLGVARVRTLSPSGAGTDTQMTPSTGANYACIDEVPYSATDYVTGAAGQRDTYAVADLPASPGSVLAVQAVAVAKQTGTGSITLKNAVRSGGTVYTGTASTLPTADSVVRTIYVTDPATSVAWTTSGVNALEAGAEVV